MMTEMNNDQDKKSKMGSRKLTAVLVIVIVALAAALILVWMKLRPQEEPAYEREAAAKLGQLEGKSEEEIQAELDRVVTEGMFHIAINSDPVFEDGASEGNLEIENVPANLYLMRVEITRQDTGELIYSTKYIEPNNHIQNAKLDVDLEAGDYPADVVFYAYSTQTQEEIGSAGCEITIHVKN